MKLSVSFGMQTGMARGIHDLLEEAPLVLSRLRCFIFLSPFWTRTFSFKWEVFFSHVVFSGSLGQRLFIYSWRLICRSSHVPVLSLSLLRTVTSILPGSLMTDVYSSAWWKFEPGARTSYRPSRLFLKSFLGWRIRASLS